MADLKEQKQKLVAVMDGYAALLERWGRKSEREELAALKKHIEKGRYQIALIGFVKRGKSTLLNALIGSPSNYNLAPMKADTCTAAIVKYLDSALYPDAPGKEGAIVQYNDGRNPSCVAVSEMPGFIDQTNPGFSKETAEHIDCIELYGNFPLIETRGAIVDTPGKGALYDQDYLTDRILPDVDIIVCPIAADYPGSMDEVKFLEKLDEQEKAKLIFVLTKTDDVEKDELADAAGEVQRTMGAIVGGTPKLYKVAAKKVLDAYKSGKNAAEVAAIKARPDCGMKELENVMDTKLRTAANISGFMRQSCTKLGDSIDADKKRFQEEKETLSLSSAELDQKKRDLEAFCGITKKSFDKNKRKFEQKWNSEVNRFTAKFGHKEAAIADRLAVAVNKENLLTLIGYTSKLQRKIQALLTPELESEVNELNGKLTDLVEDFSKEFQSDIDAEVELYGRSRLSNDLKGELSTLIGGGVAVGGGLWGASTALGAVGSIAAAAAKLATAQAEVGSAAANAGTIVTWISRVFGVGKVASTIGTVATTQGTLVSALIGSVVPVLGGVAVAALAFRLGTKFAKGQAEKNIPKIVGEQIEEAKKAIEESSAKMLDAVLSQFQTHLDEVLANKQSELEDIREQVQELNAGAKLREIEQDLQALAELSKRLTAVSNVL
ncbi:dynamin family protein [Breznakiellaceae bacterium SP9]